MRYGREIHVPVTLLQTYQGRAEDRLEVTFENPVLQQRFIIIRLLKAIVGSEAEYAALRPTAPYVPKRRGKRAAEKEVIPGVPPLGVDVPWVVKLPKAPIPPAITSALRPGSVAKIIEQLKRTMLPSVLGLGTHARFFKVLLWIEENRTELVLYIFMQRSHTNTPIRDDLRIYDIDNAVLTKQSRYYL